MFYWSGKAKALACFEVCYSTLGMPVVLCPEAENIQLIHLTRYRTLRKISVVIESLSVCVCVARHSPNQTSESPSAERRHGISQTSVYNENASEEATP